VEKTAHQKRRLVKTVPEMAGRFLRRRACPATRWAPTARRSRCDRRLVHRAVRIRFKGAHLNARRLSKALFSVTESA